MSKIEWTDRSDWNPIRGCTRVSEGCRNCYAERIAARFSDPGQPFHGFAKRTAAGGRWTGKVELIEERLDFPLRWRKPARIFVNSTYDLFHESVPNHWIDQVFAIMALAPQHTFQVLTKRPWRMLDWFQRNPYKHILRQVDAVRDSRPNLIGIGVSDPTIIPWRNVWLGTSIEDQAAADERIPLLLQTPAAVRFVSAEPLLGAVDVSDELQRKCGHCDEPIALCKGGRDIYNGARCCVLCEHDVGIDWVIAGGESGPNARPSHPDWFRSLRDQCQAAGVPFFFKQWGEWWPVGPLYSDNDTDEHTAAQDTDPDEYVRDAWITQTGIRWQPHLDGQPPPATHAMHRCGKRAAGRLLDGREWNEYPVTHP